GGDAAGRAVGICSRDEGDLQQTALERTAPLAEAGHRKCTQRVAMVGARSRNESPLVGPTARMPVLQRYLQRRLDSFGAAAAVHAMTEIAAEVAQDERGQLLERLGGEQIPVRTRDLAELRCDCRVHLGIGMADAERRRTARAIEVAVSTGIKQVAALAAN